SQTTDLIDDDPDGFVLSTELLEPFMGNYEYFFFPSEAKPAVTITYFDALYSENGDPWNFETSPYEHEKYRNTLDAISNKEYKYALEIGCANGVFTEQLAAECKRLLALELNETALKIAEKRCAHHLQCRFLKWDIALGLPKGNFDLIVFSEVGYYFIKEKLQQIFKDVNEILVGGGIFVMVHWTAYVRHYPLTGLQVHEIFANDHSEGFNLKINQRHELYELLVWEKVEK
ncbi:MAG: SAM-dependent methyltransferase, partial [Christiangramia sp.]